MHGILLKLVISFFLFPNIPFMTSVVVSMLLIVTPLMVKILARISTSNIRLVGFEVDPFVDFRRP